MIGTLLTLTAACENWQGGEPAICEATQDLRQDHAGALLDDGGPLSRDTGERLLTGLAVVC